MVLEKHAAMLYPQEMAYGTDIMGIMADSHGNNGLLASAITALESLGARTLIHLGDMCDTRAPLIAEEAFRILGENGVSGVRGNNECQMLHDLRSARGRGDLQHTIDLLEGLPYTANLGPFWFAHSAPYPFPMATRRPISEFLPGLLSDAGVPFTILFRGHSHKPSILEVNGPSWEKIPSEADRDIPLDPDLRYIITVGAVEKGASVLFDPARRMLRFVTVPGL